MSNQANRGAKGDILLEIKGLKIEGRADEDWIDR